MRLVKFTLVGGDNVYINPEQVASVDGDTYSCNIRTSNGKNYYISSSINSVVDRLTTTDPQ